MGVLPDYVLILMSCHKVARLWKEIGALGMLLALIWDVNMGSLMSKVGFQEAK